MGRAPGRQRRAAFPSLFPKLGYDPIKDFAPVTTVAFSPHALVVHPSVPANTVPELVAYAKSKPDGLNFANPGVGTLIQLAAEQFKTLNGIKLWSALVEKRASQRRTSPWRCFLCRVARGQILPAMLKRVMERVDGSGIWFPMGPVRWWVKEG